jgi:peptidoglycan/xylan/chitin deacetylase (PgdA/CDA1 family)
MNLLRLFFLLLMLCSARVVWATEATAATGAAKAPTVNSFYVLIYHDVYATTSDAARADSLAISVDDLVRQFSWLRDNGYSVVSLDDVIASRSQNKALPERSVMLTFDDGYVSFHNHALPLLKLFKYPATLAVVAGWVESPSPSQIEYESDRAPIAATGAFMNWSQIRAAAESGWVSIASHTYDMHHGAVANPQGVEQPAVTTRIYDRSNQRYESDSAYRARLFTDLKRSSDIIEARVGKRPLAIVWPYGAYNAVSSAVASELGMSVGMSLDTGVNDASVPLAKLRRVLIRKGSTLIDMVADLHPISNRSQRTLNIASNQLFSANAGEYEQRLSQTLDLIAAVKPRNVIIAAATASPGAGVQHAWFANSELKFAADQLNRAAWQIRTRTGARVFVKIPPLADGPLAERFARELGQRVPLAGVVFEHAIDVAMSATSTQFAAVRESHNTAESVYRFDWPDACRVQALTDASEQFAIYRAALAAHTWVAIRMPPCNASQWREFSALTRSIPDAQERTLIEHAFSDAQEANSTEQVARSFEIANANGFRHLSVAERDLSDSSEARLNVLKRAVSVETYPLKR